MRLYGGRTLHGETDFLALGHPGSVLYDDGALARDDDNTGKKRKVLFAVTASWLFSVEQAAEVLNARINLDRLWDEVVRYYFNIMR